MERKAAITTAAAITVTLLAGGTAMAANLGILDSEPASGLGETSPVSIPAGASTSVPTEVRTIIVDETAGGGSGGTSGAASPSATAPGATAAPTTPTSDDHGSGEIDDDATEAGDDHGDDRDDRDDDEHDDEHEYEGADDDD
jgi:hypothetical protein